MLLWHDAPFALTFDDAFYYFGIARNVAHGHGSTFDGINPTNGYHPLWMLIVGAVLRGRVGRHGRGSGAARRPGRSATAARSVLVALTAGRAIGRWDRLRGQAGGRRRVAGRRAVVHGATWCAAWRWLVGWPAATRYIVKIFVNGLESGVLVAARRDPAGGRPHGGEGGG